MVNPSLHTVTNGEVDSDVQKSPIKVRLTFLMLANFFFAILVLAMIGISTRILNDKIVSVEKNLKKELQVVSLKFVDNANVNIIYLKIKLLNPHIKHDLAKEIAFHLYKYCKVYDRDPNLLLALIDIESDFNPDALSSKGAKGLTQIMPFWKQIFRTDENFFDVETSIKYSLQILALYEKQYDDIEMALTAYNRGNHRIEVSIMSGKDPRNGYATKIMKKFNKLRDMNINND